VSGFEDRKKRVSVSSALAIIILSVCRSLQPLGIEEALSLETLEMHDNFQEGRTWEDTKDASIDSTGASSHPSAKPFSQWQCLTPRGVPTEMQISKKVAVAHSSTIELTRFQRFIRRMEGAGPKVILDRLKEDWQENTGGEVDDEVCSII
jgi:hypothetical protein